MKTKIIATILFALSLMISNAQDFSLQAKSGDVELDASLNDINIKAKTDLSLFKKDLSVEFNIGEPKIDKLIIDMKMSPADAYMTLQIANMTKKEPDVVAKSYTTNKDKGWGEIAKEMGIKPGSPEFHALKGKAKGKKDKGIKHEGGGSEEHGNGNGHGNGHGKGKNK